MSHTEKIWLLDAVRDITISRMSNTNMAVSQEGGKHAAAFMEEIYTGLHNLIDKDCEDD